MITSFLYRIDSRLYIYSILQGMLNNTSTSKAKRPSWRKITNNHCIDCGIHIVDFKSSVLLLWFIKSRSYILINYHVPREKTAMLNFKDLCGRCRCKIQLNNFRRCRNKLFLVYKKKDVGTNMVKTFVEMAGN